MNSFIRIFFFCWVTLSFIFLGCHQVNEQEVFVLPISGEITSRDAEISGLTWYGDELIILTQYPDRFLEDGHSNLFTISKQKILDVLNGDTSISLIPHKIPFFDGGISTQLPGFEGFEAIVILGNTVFLVIEAKNNGGRTAFLISGKIGAGLSEIRLDPTSLVELEPQTGFRNISYETLVRTGENIVAIYEVNGAKVNPQPEAKLFDKHLNSRGAIPFPSVEYRITDATAVNDKGKFWAINYFYPGEDFLKPEKDPISLTHGKGTTHAKSGVVERLLEFEISKEGINISDKPPIQLVLREDGQSRNWEGIVRLDDRGFIIATDKYPETILAFISFP